MTHRPLRFCHITTFYPPFSFGGDAIYVQQLSNALAARGHHVEVIHCVDSYRLLAHGETPRVEQDHPNVIIHRLESGVGALSPLATQQTGFPFFKRKQIREILARGFDVIHYHNISLVGGPQVLAMGNAVKLYSPHEYWLVCPMNVLFRYDGVACEEKKCLRCTLAYRRPPQWWRYTHLLPNALKHLDMMLYPSVFSREKHCELGVDVPSTIMRYFAPTGHAIPAAPPDRENPYFLYVGRFETLKGAHTLIPFFRNYSRARLVLVGEGSQTAELKQLVGDSPNIEFTGWLDHFRLDKVYQGATALVVPSVCYEGGPLVMVEALLQRTPTIARHIGALPDILQETGGGLVYHDDDSLRVALDDLLDHPDKRDRLGEHGYATYQRLYTPDAHVGIYLDIIEPLLSKRAAR